MILSKKKFKEMLFSNEPIIEIGFIKLDTENLFIYYDYRNDVFANFEIYNEQVNENHIEITKEYFNQLINNN